jgi:hypothetical protein
MDKMDMYDEMLTLLGVLLLDFEEYAKNFRNAAARKQARERADQIRDVIGRAE